MTVPPHRDFPLADPFRAHWTAGRHNVALRGAVEKAHGGLGIMALAWNMTTGTLVSGDSACTEAGNGLGGETLDWGHGSEEVSEKGGVSYHALMAAKDGAWSVVDGGFSWLTSKGGSGDAWNIYVMY